LCVSGDRRSGQRLGPYNAPAVGLNQWLEKDIDLLMRDRTFEHQVTPWGGG
jgi:hypothetical protein